MYPYWNLEELEYWKIAANAHFSLRGLSYDAGHFEQFLGGCEAEVLEGEVCREGRTVERGVRCAVGLAVDVDEASLVDVGIALRDSQPLLFRGVLDKEIVVVGVAGDCAVKVVAYGDASRLAGEQLEVYARLGVGIDRCMVLAVGHGKG